MTYDFSPLKNKLKDVEEWLKKEFAQIRTGRAAPSLLDSVMVEAYGGKMPLNQIGTVAVEGPRSIRIAVWDQSLIKAAEKAIQTSNLGISAATDEKGIRVSFPELTAERRTSLVKVMKEKLEQGRVSVRKLRDETWNDIQAKEDAGGMGEDEKFRFKEQMEKMIQDANKALDTLADSKEKEITS